MALSKGLLLISTFSLAWGLLAGVNSVLLRGTTGGSLGVATLAVSLVIAFFEILIVLGLIDRFIIHNHQKQRSINVMLLAPGFIDLPPATLENRYPEIHARLMALLDERNGGKERLRPYLKAFRTYVNYGLLRTLAVFFNFVDDKNMERRINELGQALGATLVMNQKLEVIELVSFFKSGAAAGVVHGLTAMIGSVFAHSDPHNNNPKKGEEKGLTEVGFALADWLKQHPI